MELTHGVPFHVGVHFSPFDKDGPTGLGLKATSTLRFRQVPNFDPVQPCTCQKVVTTGHTTDSDYGYTMVIIWTSVVNPKPVVKRERIKSNEV